MADENRSLKKFYGICDASAAVVLDREHVIVANDEDNLLRIYKMNEGGGATQTIGLDDFLGLGSKKEADIEAAARLGNSLFWIGSHGRNKNGKKSPSRQVLFAAKVVVTNGSVNLQFMGKPYRNLLSDLAADPKLVKIGLVDAAKLAPEDKGGLNIEGLAATVDGHLLIGFRNPIPKGRALLVLLLNPDEIMEGTPARFGEPILLDLGGLGIRDIVLAGKRHLILAGAFDGENSSRLYEWDGTAAPRMLREFQRVKGNPEAILVDPIISGRVHIFTDNGSTSVNGEQCKDNDQADDKFFQSFTIDLN